MDDTFYSLRQLTKELGVTARALRHYEARKLIAPTRRGMTRLYGMKDRARILMILRGRRLGFSLAQIHEDLRMYDCKDSDERDEIMAARSKFVDRINYLERRRYDINQSLRQFKECVREIDASFRGKSRTPWDEILLRQLVPDPTSRSIRTP
jgi:DNA-binding transcriptional MerR regulator